MDPLQVVGWTEEISSLSMLPVFGGVASNLNMIQKDLHKTNHSKHLPAYLDEMCFRFNNRKNPYLFRDTMLKLIGPSNLEYEDLAAKAQDAA